MRRKSIGATSQAFHEPMSTGAFLEFLTRLGCRDAGLRGLLARLPGGWGPAQRLKCWSEDGNPASHGTVKLRLRKPSGPMGLRRNKKSKTRLAGSQPVRVAGSRPQGPVGQVPRGLAARAPRAWGRFTRAPTSIFRKPPGGSLAKAWVSAETAASEVGTWRETKPGYPPYPPPPPQHFGVREKGRGFSPSPPSATIQHAPQGWRIGVLKGDTRRLDLLHLILHYWGIISLNPQPKTLNPKP